MLVGNAAVPLHGGSSLYVFASRLKQIKGVMVQFVQTLTDSDRLNTRPRDGRRVKPYRYYLKKG